MSTVKRKKLQKRMGTWTWKKRSYKVIPGKIKDYTEDWEVFEDEDLTNRNPKFEEEETKTSK